MFFPLSIFCLWSFSFNKVSSDRTEVKIKPFFSAYIDSLNKHNTPYIVLMTTLTQALTYLFYRWGNHTSEILGSWNHNTGGNVIIEIWTHLYLVQASTCSIKLGAQVAYIFGFVVHGSVLHLFNTAEFQYSLIMGIEFHVLYSYFFWFSQHLVM